tara:strand:- start:2655 stop:3653 length:999 start_codon:yes stop_codon:yes gene_type:complete
MATPNSRENLKQYCLRMLGKPVVEINVDDDQLEDRIDEGLQYFQEYHFDGVEKTYVRHKITGSTLTITNPVGTFKAGEIITGGSSNASATVHSANTTVITFKDHKDINGIQNNSSSSTFTNSETVTGDSSSATATAGTVTFGDVDNHYIPINDSIIGIVNIFDINETSGTSSSMFNFRYQFSLNEMPYLTRGAIAHYQMTQSHLQLLNDIFVGKKPIRYNKHQNRLYLDLDWANDDLKIDQFVVAEVYAIIDPDSFTDVYNDIFVKKYVTALFKRQWGANLIKYDGVQLPGGVNLNGRQMFDDAVTELTAIEAEMQVKNELPVDFVIGAGPF